MATAYFSNITALPLMIVAVCAKDINLHLQTKKICYNTFSTFIIRTIPVITLVNMCFKPSAALK